MQSKNKKIADEQIVAGCSLRLRNCTVESYKKESLASNSEDKVANSDHFLSFKPTDSEMTQLFRKEKKKGKEKNKQLSLAVCVFVFCYKCTLAMLIFPWHSWVSGTRKQWE